MELIPFESTQKLEETLREKGGSVEGVVAGGGDGTVMSVVNAIVRSQSEATLGILPLGTANIIARSLSLPSDPEEALDVLFSGQERRTDLGTCNDEAFALGAGLGVAERFVTQTPDKTKRVLGPAAYLLSLLKEIRAPKVRFRLEPDSAEPVTIAGVACVIANAAGLGHDLKIADEASVSDGLLDFCVLKRLAPMDAIRLAWKGLHGDVTHDWDVEHFQWRKATVTSEPAVAIQIDGDRCEQTSPFRIDTLPMRLRVIAPAEG